MLVPAETRAARSAGAGWAMGEPFFARVDDRARRAVVVQCDHDELIALGHSRLTAGHRCARDGESFAGAIVGGEGHARRAGGRGHTWCDVDRHGLVVLVLEVDLHAGEVCESLAGRQISQTLQLGWQVRAWSTTAEGSAATIERSTANHEQRRTLRPW